MESTNGTIIRVGDWCVNSASGQISRNGESSRLEVRTMRLLVCLAEHAGEVVSIDQLLDQVWPGVSVTPDSVYQAVAALRRLLGDDPKNPAYIATVPRLGYRMIATVGPWVEPVVTSDPQPPPKRRFRPVVMLVGALTAVLVVTAAVVWYSKGGKKPAGPAHVASVRPEKSIAVLPFLDLTEDMKHEAFADGITEELIDKLSKIPGVRVPPPTSSFYYKNKKVPVRDIARALGVVYILDGSIRRASGRMRVATRLVRAENGYVVWSGTYDRALKDILILQDDIAGEVTKALLASIEANPSQPESH